MAEKNSSMRLEARPPVVAVLGHVDHGKTTLLDWIRKSHIAAKEAGGITQSIGAYKIDFKGQKITFIDTPGHAAFSKMRECGGQAADLVILVVAADDGVMPQTIECLGHIKTASVPFLVAINKIDLPAAEVERVKKQLSQNGVLLEGYGGEVVALPISAKTGEGINDLLEMILLLAQMQELKADSEGMLQGIVIEAKKGKAGAMATVVVKNGTLRLGDQILAGEVSAKVKGLFDENQKKLEKVTPGEAVEVLGFSSLPQVGAPIKKAEAGAETVFSVENLPIPRFTKEQEKKFKIVVKADSVGSFEAILSNLKKDEVLMVSGGIGEIIDSDVLLSQIVKAKIFGFRVKASASVAKLAESEGVEIKTYQIIYQFLEELEKEQLKFSSTQREEKILGKAEIVAEFLVDGLRIAGCRVIEGKITRGDLLQLKRGEKILGQTTALSLKQKSKEISEVKAREDFGVRLEPLLDFKMGDMLISARS